MPDSEPPADDERFPDVVEPGSPSLEGALFVLLGALSMIAVILRLAGLV